MTTALGVAPDPTGRGVDPPTHRRIIKAHWENTGIVCGLDVTGRSDLRYSVAAGVAVCSRGNERNRFISGIQRTLDDTRTLRKKKAWLRFIIVQ